ncbi:serine/threonine-protein kinase SCH9 [Coccidioides immitis RMSCC 2394]|uniref:Serine/threonine-protein kinase SCH9 n=1 Tax=Coccidioides immitis RMSCC 2394 TaxID=404692 RepID=A0A0J7BCG4_COCIT|nr:serine/threonine-protein kinase SCH9 [Coccidioides immitis RMSCC 2394]
MMEIQIQPIGATSSKKKRRNKRRQNPAAFPELFPPEDGNNRASTSRSGTPKAPSPLLQPLRGAGKSPAFRPATPNGISALKMQLDALNLTPSEAPSSNASVMGSEAGTSCASVVSDSDQTETYEVHLEHDFVSSEANDGEKGASDGLSKEQKRNILYRKMSAEDFEPLTCLGKGTYGTVLLVRHKITGALYAQKQFRKASLTVHKKLVEQTKTERAILESVNRYPFIVNLYYAFQDHEKLYLILEYAQGGELFTHLAMERMFTEDVAAFYMAELVLALEHLHHNIGVIYRDLKPENCLLDTEGHLLLTDFGLSKVSVNGEDRCNSSLGTVEYMAPEVIQALERRELDPPIKPVVTDPALAENFSADFTTLPLSPVVTSKGSFRDRMNKGEEGFGACSPTRPRPMEMNAGFQDDPFGGFSFVAPSSLLDSEFNYGAGRLA